MFKKFFFKYLFLILKSILTAVIVSAVLAIVIFFSVGKNLGEGVYFSAVDIFYIYTIYSFPLILIAGFITDVLIKQIISLFYSNKHYVLWKVLIYIFYTIIIAFILVLIFNNENSLNLLNLSKSTTIVWFTAFIYYILTNLINRFKDCEN